MTRTITFFATVAGGLAILAFAAATLVYTVPSRGAEPRCKAGEVRVSWYGRESGRRTAMGRPFDGSQLIVAHKTIRFGTKVRFTYHGRSVTLPVAGELWT